MQLCLVKRHSATILPSSESRWAQHNLCNGLLHVAAVHPTGAPALRGETEATPCNPQSGFAAREQRGFRQDESYVGHKYRRTCWQVRPSDRELVPKDGSWRASTKLDANRPAAIPHLVAVWFGGRDLCLGSWQTYYGLGRAQDGSGRASGLSLVE